MKIQPTALYENPRNGTFIMVANRAINDYRPDVVQYMLGTHSMSGPNFVYPCKGLTVVRYNLEEYGSDRELYSEEGIGGIDFRLDPLCRAVLKRGWSRNMLHMTFEGIGCLRNPLLSGRSSFRQMDSSPTWTGSTNPHMIEPFSSHDRSNPGGSPSWAIHVDFEDNKHIGFHVAVPQIYMREDELHAFLDVMETFPRPQDIGQTHPATFAEVR